MNEPTNKTTIRHVVTCTGHNDMLLVFNCQAMTHKYTVPETIVFSSQYFWSYVVWRSAERGRRVTRPNSLLTHSIISQLYMAFMVQQHIVQFQIAVYDTCKMNKLTSENSSYAVTSQPTH